MRGPTCLFLAAAIGASPLFAGPTEIPIIPGVTFVIAVSDSTSAGDKDAGLGLAQGDYETVVAISAVTDDAVTQTAFIDGVDATDVRRQVSIPRVVRFADVRSAAEQVFGSYSDDPPTVRGTTSLGPSRRVVGDLVRTGAAAYSFRNYASRAAVSGTLHRSATRVKFPVLLNGKRVELDALHATGQMASDGVSRPFETVILDHPRYPISLRIAYGPRGGAHPFTPAFAREIVRIETPDGGSIAGGLVKDCRLELRGIYFDFNRATIKPESARALQEIASALQTIPQGRFTIEGHTDDIGSDRYNGTLSAERAAAVKAALVRDHGVEAARLSTTGHGERRPIESNATLAGRARNRRVELVCARN